MSLPYDVHRCAGAQYDGEWREGCDDCLRRTSPGDPDRQAWIDAPLLVVFECEHRIAPAECSSFCHPDEARCVITEDGKCGVGNPQRGKR